MRRMLTVFLLMSSPAFATGDYTDNTPCSQIDTAMSQQDQDAEINYFQYVTGVFSNLDSMHVENGEPGIVGQWSDDGTLHSVILVSGWCEEHPKETVYNAAAEVYNGLRGMEMALGGAK